MKKVAGFRISGSIVRTMLAASLLVVASCAARGPSPQVTADLSRADALVRTGCYRCLQEAAAAYARHRTAARAPAAPIATGAFEATVLLALREREMGIPADATIARARQLAVDLPSSSPLAADAEAILQLTDLVYGDRTSVAPETRRLPYPEWQRQMKPLRDRIAAAGGARLADYLVLSADCSDRTSREAIDAAHVRTLHAAAPLVEFRLALCGLSSDEGLDGLGRSDPRWFEA